MPERVIWGIPSTLTNTTLVTPTISGGTVTGADITVGAGKTLDVSAGTLTLADDQIATSKIGAGALPSDVTVNNDNWSGTDLAVTNGGTGASTAADAFTALKQAATESATGVAELATVTEAITGTDTSRITTPAGVAGAMAVQTNPLAKSQGVHMTYASSGSTGIVVADNDNIDFGTGDFTLVWKGSLPDWTPAYNVYLISKYQDASNQVYVAVDNGGTLSFYSAKAGTVARADGSIVNTLTNNSEHEIVFVVIRESLGANGNCSVYIDGKLFETLTISAASPIDISNTGALNIAGRNAARYDSVNKSAYTYNCALSASEVLDLYRHGPAFADKWGSQTELITTQNNRDFSGGTIGDWTKLTAGSGTLAYNTDAIGGADNKQGLLTSAGDDYLYAYLLNTKFPTIEQGKRYTFEFNAYVPAGNTNKSVRIGFQDADVTFTDFTFTLSGDTWTKVKSEFVANAPMSGISAIRLGFYNTSANGDKIYFDDISIVKVGATLALESEGIQPAPGQWLDSSTNKLHAMQPASGSSLLRKKDTFEVRWTNTWAGTHEAQYIGGFNQAVLPANCYIESIIGVISGSTIEDIIIGDGSDTDRWVTITSGLSAGTTSFTLANRISDGTNYKLVVDPDANFTGSIAWTIKGIILQ